MPATPDDIAAGMRAARIATWYDASIKARYSTARDGSKTVAEGFFDSFTDAQAVMTARAALIGVERRRFSIEAEDLLWLSPSPAAPTVTVIDSEQALSGAMLVSRIEVDADGEKTTVEVFG